MPTIQEMCAQVRLMVDEPLPQKPSLRRVLQAVLQSTQSFYSKLENTGQAWSIMPDYQLNVQSSVGDYLLAVDDSYGKPIQVLTYYPQNASYAPRYVEFFEFQEMNFNWNMPANIASWMYTDGSPCTAMRMAFYKKNGQSWVRVLPKPQLTASYLITFASGDWASNASLQDSPVLTQFHSLVEIWAAESVLPSCQWGKDMKYNMEHRKEIALALKNDEFRLTDDFERYCRNIIDDHMTVRVGSFDADAGWGM